MSAPLDRRIVSPDRIVRVDRVFKRFDLSHRLEHAALIVAIGVLLLTGLPQKFSQWSLSVTLIGWMGGIETTRLIHRVVAVLLIALAVAHALGTAYRFLVLRLPPYIVLLTSDLRDLAHGVRHRLGRADDPPQLGRFTYQEKLLYWAVVWSVLILIASGLMMWNPIASTRFLTGQIIPAARRAHGSEALLLLMVGVGWHLWHVLRQRNWSVFTGLLNETEMIRSHPVEWDAIMAGRDRLPLDLMAVRRRRRGFWALGSVLTLALAGCLLAFVGFEQTAVATHPERQPVQITHDENVGGVSSFQNAPSPEMPVPTWDADIGPLLAGQCGGCHGEGDDLDLSDYRAVTESGTLVVPGQPSQSDLVAVQAVGDHPGQLSGDGLALVIVWIANGALR